jgi:hypothetical protein
MTRPTQVGARTASPPHEHGAKLIDSESISDAIASVPTQDKVAAAAYSPKIGTTQASVSKEEAK